MRSVLSPSACPGPRIAVLPVVCAPVSPAPSAHASLQAGGSQHPGNNRQGPWTPTTSEFAKGRRQLSLHSLLLPSSAKLEACLFPKSHGAVGRPSRSSQVSAMSASPSVATSAANNADVIPGVIIGAGRVGTALAAMGGGRDTVVRRGEALPLDSAGPILVCTRNDALESVVEQTPKDRREDLVFLQNGMLDPWLSSRGLQDATQVLVYFAVAKLGDAPLEGVTDLNPSGLTAASGKWAPAVAARLHSAGLSCRVLSREEFEGPMLEKLIWISAFMLVGARHGKISVGEVESKHREDVAELIQELANAATAHQRQLPGRADFAFGPQLVDRLCAYARSVAHFPTAIKELEWRNRWFLEIAEEAVKKGEPDPCPLHKAWLKEVGAIP